MKGMLAWLALQIPAVCCLGLLQQLLSFSSRHSDSGGNHSPAQCLVEINLPPAGYLMSALVGQSKEVPNDVYVARHLMISIFSIVH